MPGVDCHFLVVSNQSLVPAQKDRRAFGVAPLNFDVAPTNSRYVAPMRASSAYVGSNSSAFTSAISFRSQHV